MIDYGYFRSAGECPPSGLSSWVNETWVAASPNRHFAVQISQVAPQFDSSGTPVPCSSGPGRIRYAIGSNQSENWRSGFVPVSGLEDLTVGLVDPCVVSINSNSDNYYLVAMSASKIFGCRYVVPPIPSLPSFTQWKVIDAPNAQVDKPWIVRGSDDEIYAAYFRKLGGPARVGRSIDGGISWIYQDTVAPPPADPQGSPIAVQSFFCLQLGVMGHGSLYLARNRSNTIYDFLIATDRNGPQGENEGLELDFLRDAQGQALELAVNAPANQELAPGLLPWAGGASLHLKRIPWILPDPTEANRVFVVYQDTESASGAGAERLNVYLRTLVHEQDEWSIGARVPVAPNSVFDCQGESPQAWLPATTIDRFGRVHVLYYFNRVTDDGCLTGPCQPNSNCCGIATHGPIYDAWYAVSIHDVQDGEILGFDSKNLRTSCAQHPALDSGILANAPFPLHLWNPLEYNGIALDDSDPNWTTVWMTYSGLLVEDDESIDPSAIYASRILVENPQQ